MKWIDIFGIRVSNVNKSEALSSITHWISGHQSIPSFPKLVFTPNPEMIVLAQKDAEFKSVLNSADLNIPDGVGLRLANRNLKTLHGLDLFESLIQLAAKNDWKVMLLGGKPGFAKLACQKLKIENCKLKIAGVSGPSNIIDASQAKKDSLISEINSHKPVLLFVAFGHGKQEKWLIANRSKLKVDVAMGVGGVFDQIADPSLRPPEFIDQIGFGWLYRLIRQPWRWKRQLALLKFLKMILMPTPS